MDAFDQKLADWKARHGYVNPTPTTPEEADAADEALRAADRKLTGEDYCVQCGKGPLPIAELSLITRRDDPYIQPEDDSDEDEEDRLPEIETRVRACPTCWAEHYGPEADED